MCFCVTSCVSSLRFACWPKIPASVFNFTDKARRKYVTLNICQQPQYCTVCLLLLPCPWNHNDGKAAPSCHWFAAFQSFHLVRGQQPVKHHKWYTRQSGTGNGNGCVLVSVAVATTLAALNGRQEKKSYDYWTETQARLIARGSLLCKKQPTERRYLPFHHPFFFT